MEMERNPNVPDVLVVLPPVKKAPLCWLKLIAINLIAFGLELCASAGFCYIPPILLKKGFPESALTVILGIGPFISLLLVPSIGHWSDHCLSPYGRRRPFITGLGLLIIYSLLMIPFSREIANCFGLIDDAYCLAVGVILLDFSTQAIMNPCKALIPDLFKNAEEQNFGFAIYSFMLAMGGVIGYLMSSINWENTSLGKTFGGQEKAVFSVLAVCFVILLVLNLFFATETPLENMICLSNMDKSIHKHAQCEILLNGSSSLDAKMNSPLIKPHVNRRTSASQACFAILYRAKIRNFLCHNSCISKCLHLLLNIHSKIFMALKFNFLYFYQMSPVMRNLFVSCLFGWMGLMCHDLFYTDFVAQVIYQGKPKAENESSSLKLYNEGVRMGSWGLLLHCLSAAIYSALIQHQLVKSIGLRKTFFAGIIVFTLSLFATVLTNSLILVTIFTTLSGAGYIALSTVPCTLITAYHSSQQLYGSNSIDRGIGEDLAVLDSAFYLSQIIPSLFLGYMVDLSGTSSTYMLVAALFGAVSVLLSFSIKFPPENDI